jgi:acetyltransferase-like isoleucine patch superfamily enzyme
MHTLDLGTMIHQRIYIRPGSRIGMGSVVTKHIPPLVKAFGTPAIVRGFNVAKADCFSFSEIDENIFQAAY